MSNHNIFKRKRDRILLEVMIVMVDQEVIMIYYDTLLEKLDDAKRATYFLEDR